VIEGAGRHPTVAEKEGLESIAACIKARIRLLDRGQRRQLVRSHRGTQVRQWATARLNE